jgi:hypothetical protein
MDSPMGEPEEGMGEFCIRRRWSFSAAGFTLAACIFFVGLILVLPFRSESWTMGLVLLALSVWIALLSVVLPLLGTCLKDRRKRHEPLVSRLDLPGASPASETASAAANEDGVRVFERDFDNEAEL